MLDAITSGHLELGPRGRFLYGIRPRFRQWQEQLEGSAASFRRLKVNRSIVPLHDLVGLRQPNPAATLLGGEVEFEDFFLQVLGDTRTFITNFSDHHVLLPPG